MERARGTVVSGSRAASEDEAEMLIMEKWMRVPFENKCYFSP